MLVGINIDDSWLLEVASVVSCKISQLPFIYMGFPMTFVFLELVIDRIKSRNLSFRGRLILLQFVLSSLPVYTISFFKAPSGIIFSIESILIKKNKGGGEDHRKIAWVD